MNYHRHVVKQMVPIFQNPNLHSQKQNQNEIKATNHQEQKKPIKEILQITQKNRYIHQETTFTGKTVQKMIPIFQNTDLLPQTRPTSRTKKSHQGNRKFMPQETNFNSHFRFNTKIKEPNHQEIKKTKRPMRKDESFTCEREPPEDKEAEENDQRDSTDPVLRRAPFLSGDATWLVGVDVNVADVHDVFFRHSAQERPISLLHLFLGVLEILLILL